MGAVDEITVTLRIFGDDLDPDEITQLLRVAPTKARRRGDLNKKGIPDKIGSWRLASEDPRQTPLETQIEHLLSTVTDDLSVWSNLSHRFQIDLFCGLFLDKDNRGEALSAGTMHELGKRGIDLILDIYSAVDDSPKS